MLTTVFNKWQAPTPRYKQHRVAERDGRLRYPQLCWTVAAIIVIASPWRRLVVPVHELITELACPTQPQDRQRTAVAVSAAEPSSPVVHQVSLKLLCPRPRFSACSGIRRCTYSTRFRRRGTEFDAAWFAISTLSTGPSALISS